MSLPSAIPSFLTGFRMPAGSGLQALADLQSSVQSIAAAAGGGQTNATQINSAIVKVTTCASDSDSVKLPPALPGYTVFIANPSAHTLAVFGAGTDTINDVATATGVTQATLVHALYVCPTAGQWYRNLSA